MKAAWFEQFGKAEDVLQLGEQPDPQTGDGEVRVALQSSAVNPSDVKKRAGSAPALLANGLVIPHSDGAGVIDAVGAGVDRSRIGQRVWVYQAQHGRRFGTAAVAVVNHREPGWGKKVVAANGGKKVDRVVEVDFGRNLPETLEAVRTGGCIATYASMGDPEPKLPFYRMMFMDLTLRLVLVYEMPREAKQAAINDIEQWLAAGKLQHRLAEVMPLSDIVRAHQRVESGEPRGCVVLRCDA
jgi:NADPH:quinone reductase-like Zn-dependent oxidoreductase